MKVYQKTSTRRQKMLSEADIRMEIDEALKNKGWHLTGKNKNVFGERGYADYILKPKDREYPLIVIEAKKPTEQPSAIS